MPPHGADITEDNVHYSNLFAFHRLRHPETGKDRIGHEVKDYLRRAAELPPDLRPPEAGGLVGVGNAQARDAWLLALRSEEDITRLFPRSTSDS